MSQQQSQLNSAMQAALVELVKQQIPAGQPVTFDTVEEAVVQLLRKLGPELLTMTLLDQVSDPAHPGRVKKGQRRSANAVK